VLGNVSQEYLEEEEEVLCAKCRVQNRRQVLRELKELNLNWVDGEVATHAGDEGGEEKEDGDAAGGGDGDVCGENCSISLDNCRQLGE